VDFNDPECGYYISEDENSLEIYLDGEYLSEHSTVSLEKLNHYRLKAVGSISG